MTDLHTHVLPAIDDGSKTAKEAATLVRKLAAQGVECIVATPHFLPYRESVDSFVKRRSIAAEKLQEELSDLPSAPKILLGSEVLFSSSIFNLPDLRPLCIEGTNKLLLEFSENVAVSPRLLQHMIRFPAEKGVVPVLAHIERYKNLISSKSALQELIDHDCLLQLSCNAIAPLLLRRKVKSVLKNEMVHALGSDAHNLTTRPPTWDENLEMIQKNCNPAYFRALLASKKIWQ